MQRQCVFWAFLLAVIWHFTKSTNLSSQHPCEVSKYYTHFTGGREVAKGHIASVCQNRNWNSGAADSWPFV